VLEVIARVRWQVADLHRCKSGVPTRRVVGPTTPRVIDGHQPGFLGVPIGQKVAVPGQEPRVDVVQEGTDKVESLLTLTPGSFPDVPDGDGVDRRLGQATGVGRRRRGIGGSSGASPMLRARIIAVGRSLRVEDDVGNLAGPPLVGK